MDRKKQASASTEELRELLTEAIIQMRILLHERHHLQFEIYAKTNEYNNLYEWYSHLAEMYKEDNEEEGNNDEYGLFDDKDWRDSDS